MQLLIYNILYKPDKYLLFYVCVVKRKNNSMSFFICDYQIGIYRLSLY